MWKLVHGISGRNQAYAGKIDGSTEEERVGAWKNHFEGLLGQPPTVTQSAERPPYEENYLPYR